MNTGTDQQFGERDYWLARHKRLQGDVRSVGNLGHSLEENLNGQVLTRERVGKVLGYLFPDPRGKLALDLGSGVGLLAPIYVDLGFDYLGVELSPVAVKQAREHCRGARFEIGDITSFRSKRKHDVVMVAHVLVHLVRDEDWKKALTTISKSLLPSGILLLIDQIPDDERQRTVEHAVVRTLKDYQEVLPRYGLCLNEARTRELRDSNARREFRQFFVIEKKAAAT